MVRVLDLLKNCSNDEPYEDFSYNVESLFTSIPVQDTIDCILKRVYIVGKFNLFVKNQFLKNYFWN